MKDILIDTNIISVLVTGERRGDSRHVTVKQRFPSNDRRKVLIPIIAVMEIECGLVMGERANPSPEATQEIANLRAFLGKYPKVKIDSDIVQPYALVRAKVFDQYCEKRTGRQGYKQNKTHNLTDRVTDITLGIDERDLIIVCMAIQRNLTLATLDDAKEMAAIIAAVRVLECESRTFNGRRIMLDVEYWDQPIP
jgi:predicted nucleic acid-binding protein